MTLSSHCEEERDPSRVTTSPKGAKQSHARDRLRNLNRFQDFFEEDKYLTLKNHLYNYRLRKRAVEKSLEGESPSLILEAGSGISPVVTNTNRIVYSELSSTALETLRREQKGRGWYVAADVTRLPFKTGAFSHAVSSEVLEHIENDQAAIQELSRIVRSGGALVVTFPHRKFYFTIDDAFVKHFRRYELSEMESYLLKVGFRTCAVEKVLGPLDKLGMCLAVLVYSLIQKIKKSPVTSPSTLRLRSGQAPLRTHHQSLVQKTGVIDYWLSVIGNFLFKWANWFYMLLAWCDAKIMPRSLSTILLIKARKE